MSVARTLLVVLLLSFVLVSPLAACACSLADLALSARSGASCDGHSPASTAVGKRCCCESCSGKLATGTASPFRVAGPDPNLVAPPVDLRVSKVAAPYPEAPSPDAVGEVRLSALQERGGIAYLRVRRL